MTDTLTLAAPAKINLWLRILRRREDGFHDLETRLLPVGLADTLAITRVGGPAGGARFTCSDPTVPGDASNLVMKAVAALAEEVGPLPPLEVHLTKKIPHGAGLGGGSSDAAAALRGIDQLLGLNLGVAVLSRLAGRIGSDVPFFLHGTAADCRGRGEVVDPVGGGGCRLPVLLIKLPFPVPTAWAYGHWRDSVEIPGIRYRAQVLACGELVNDLERPVFAKHLVLADLKMWLLGRPEVVAALLSGSGSTIFAVLRDDRPTPCLIKDLREEFDSELWSWQGWAG